MKEKKQKKEKKEKKEKDATRNADPDPRQFMLGHVTLVGGALIAEPWQATRGLPQAHISGTLYARPDGTLCIDNDSGRFSEYEDRVLAHLKSVADMFARLGLPVAVDWMPKAPIPWPVRRRALRGERLAAASPGRTDLAPVRSAMVRLPVR